MSEPASEKFLVRDPQGNIFGPADADMLRRWVTEGRIVPGMAIAPRDTTDWVEASIHPATADLLQQRLRQVMETQSNPTTALSANTPVSQADSMIGYASPTRPNVLGIVSFGTGLVSLLLLPLTCLCICLTPFAGPASGLFALAAVTMGALAVWQIRSEPARFHGRGFAVAGLTMGTITLLVYVTLLLVGLIQTFTSRP